MTSQERKDLERAAFGKRITFHTRHHWILTWLEERPGKNLADKVWRLVNDAYRDDYAARGRAEIDRYWVLIGEFDYDNPDPQQELLRDMLTSLSNACEYFNRAGYEGSADVARDLMRTVLFQQQKRAESEAVQV